MNSEHELPLVRLCCFAQVDRIEVEKLKAVGLRNRVAAMQEVSPHHQELQAKRSRFTVEPDLAQQ
jgi:hypothetical protein